MGLNEEMEKDFLLWQIIFKKTNEMQKQNKWNRSKQEKLIRYTYRQKNRDIFVIKEENDKKAQNLNVTTHTAQKWRRVENDGGVVESSFFLIFRGLHQSAMLTDLTKKN